MFVKKAGGKIIGAQLTKAEQKAMDIEIKRQLVEWDHKHMLELDAVVLWELHEQLGFGYDRLKAFYDAFSHGLADLIKRYEMESDDMIWLCTYKLKDRLGIDLEAWNHEKEVEE